MDNIFIHMKTYTAGLSIFQNACVFIYFLITNYSFS